MARGRRASVENVVNVSTELQAHLSLPVEHLESLQHIFEGYCSGGGRTQNLTILGTNGFNSFVRDCRIAAGNLAYATTDLIYIQKVIQYSFLDLWVFIYGLPRIVQRYR